MSGSGRPALGAAPLPVLPPPDVQREVDRNTRDIEALTQTISSRNAQYLRREEELSNAITAAANRAAAAASSSSSPRGGDAGGVVAGKGSAAPPSGNPFAALDSAISDMSARVTLKRHEEVLAGTAIVRIQSHIVAEDRTAAQLGESLQDLNRRCESILDSVTRHQATLTGVLGTPHLNSTVVPVVRRPSPPPPPHVTTADAQLAPHTTEALRHAETLQWNFTTGLPQHLRADGDVRVAAARAADESIRSLRHQFDEQSAVLQQTQEALDTLQQRSVSVRDERNRLRRMHDEIVCQVANIDRDRAQHQSAEEAAAVETSLFDQVLALRATSTSKKRMLESVTTELTRLTDSVTHCKQLREMALASRAAATDALQETSKKQAILDGQIRCQQDVLRSVERDHQRLQQSAGALTEEDVRLQSRIFEEEATCDAATSALLSARQEGQSLSAQLEAKASDVARLTEMHAHVIDESQATLASNQAAKQGLIQKQRQVVERRAAIAAKRDKISYLRGLLPAHHPLANLTTR